MLFIGFHFGWHEPQFRWSSEKDDDLVISSSRNANGLPPRCSHAAMGGVREWDALVEEIRLNDLEVGMHLAYDDGQGTCYSDRGQKPSRRESFQEVEAIETS